MERFKSRIFERILRFQVGLELVDPAEAAGFAGAGKKALGSNGAPVVRAVPLDVLDEDNVLLRHPRSFSYARRRRRRRRLKFFPAAAGSAATARAVHLYRDFFFLTRMLPKSRTERESCVDSESGTSSSPAYSLPLSHPERLQTRGRGRYRPLRFFFQKNRNKNGMRKL